VINYYHNALVLYQPYRGGNHNDDEQYDPVEQVLLAPLSAAAQPAAMGLTVYKKSLRRNACGT
jgi:hypothetical protein